MVPDTGRAEPALTSLRELVRHVGHDLNNHLASIIVNLSLAGSPSAQETERMTQIHEALTAARHAATLARELFAAGVTRPAAADEATSPGSSLPGSTPAGALGAGALDAAAFGTAAPGTAARATRASSDAATDDMATNRGATDPGSPTFDPGGPDAALPDTYDSPSPAGTLLVLEDDESVATMMKDVLRHFGYEVTVTQSPEACVVLYEQGRATGRPFDLVILDLTIRGGQRRGMDTLAALRIVDPAIRAVAHSGDPEVDVMKDPLRYGFVGAIRKPTPLAQLSRLVQNLIAKGA